MDIQQHLQKLLNPQQFQAVTELTGPLLILAGAGSGKTRVLTYRIANMIAQGEASPDEILAVTFTNKAAREMEARSYQLLESFGFHISVQMWISTFHSTCVRLLRENIHLLEYQPFFVIYDDSDQLSMIKKVLEVMNINEKVYPAKGIKAKINEAKMLALGPEDLHNKYSSLMDDRDKEVYAEYERQMKRANSLDFGDLLLKTYELFRMYPDVLETYRKKFRFILVDEYQDTNHIQYLIIKMLAQEHRNLCVVGDEDQSIYSWRGADITNILNFEKDFPEAKVIKLEENYRSTRTIVTAASELIKNNTQRKNKVLFTSNPEGQQILVREENSDYDEARFVAQSVATRMQTSGDLSYNDFAIFYRTNAQSRVIEDQLRSRQIPYKIVGGMKFYERMEIKDLLAYMKLVLNPNDDIALQRIINVPARGIGKTTVEKLQSVGHERKITMLKGCEVMAQERTVHAGACKKLHHFFLLMEDLIEHSKGLKPSEVFHLILDKTGYVLQLKGENTPESQARIENLEEFNNAIVQFEKERGEEASLQSFLEEIALVSDADSIEDDVNFVTLMTLHISKGLEFPHVFIVGLEEGLFPTVRAFESYDPTALEEERRLAYVGMTRARQYLTLTYARNRRVWGQEQQHAPSRFIAEIPEQYIKFETALTRPAFLDRYQTQYGSSESANDYTRSNTKRGGRNTFNKQEDFTAEQFPNYEDFSDTGSDSVTYKKGMRVRHPTFGAGTIYVVEGSGDTQKVGVMFGNQTLKKFIVKYARLEII